MIFCIFTYIHFIVSKSKFNFKGSSSISKLHFDNVNFQMKQFVIFQKFLWNSVYPIWGVTMNLIEVTYTKIKYIITKFLRLRWLCFFIGQNDTKRNSGRSLLNQSKEVLCIFVSFQKFRDLMNDEPKTHVYDAFLSYWRTF